MSSGEVGKTRFSWDLKKTGQSSSFYILKRDRGYPKISNLFKLSEIHKACRGKKAVRHSS